MYIPNEHNVTPPTLEYYSDARDAFLGDPASELAALLIDHVRESRQSYLEQTAAEEQHLRTVQSAQIDAMRDEADKLRDAGEARGLGLIASGTLTIIGAGVKAGTPSADVPADAPSADVPADAPSADVPGPPREPKGTDWSAVANGAAKGAEGGGELFAADDDRQGQLARTRATEYEHQSGEAERRFETLNEAHSHTRELERSAFEHLRNVRETEAA